MNRVLVVFGMQLVATTLETMLSKEANFYLLSIPYKDWKDTLESIQDFHPDILILDDSIVQANQFKPMGLMEVYPRLKVIIIYPDRNQVRIYEQRLITISNSSDLLTSLVLS